MNKIYIFGAGKRGRGLLKLINRLEIADVIAFIDNDTEKQGMIEGKRCISIREAIKDGAQNELVIVSIAGYKEIESQLKDHNFKNVFYWSKFFPDPEYCLPIIYETTDYQYAKPFNFYESPYPNIVEIHKEEKKLFDRNKNIMDIDLNISRQLELIKEMETKDLPEWENTGEGLRYRYDNTWFGKGSADALCYMMQIIKPNKIIEIGSGYSTAVMLDTNEKYFNNEIHIVSIEPRADRLRSLLKPTDNLKIIEQDVQEIEGSFFETLGENDFLFIDSSHVSKMASDVNYILFELLPRLKKGVYIHFHDMFYPFIYPKEWVYSGLAYNEMYLLRAFLMNNETYTVQLFGDMLYQKQIEGISKKLEGCGAGSLWIKKNSV